MTFSLNNGTRINVQSVHRKLIYRAMSQKCPAFNRHPTFKTHKIRNLPSASATETLLGDSAI